MTFKEPTTSSQPNFGEIIPGHGRGDLLLAACRQGDVNSIVEIGTLDGTGSTKIIISALQKKNPAEVNFVTVEAYHEANQLARKNIGEQAFPVKVLHGNLIHIDSPLLVLGLNQEEQTWLKSDTHSRFSNAPFVLNEIPDAFDLLVLDGGEFTTFNDYLLLRMRCKYLYLDDIRVRKNRLVLRTALEDGFVVIQCVDDGNGACLLSRLHDKGTQDSDTSSE